MSRSRLAAMSLSFPLALNRASFSAPSSALVPLGAYNVPPRHYVLHVVNVVKAAPEKMKIQNILSIVNCNAKEVS